MNLLALCTLCLVPESTLGSPYPRSDTISLAQVRVELGNDIEIVSELYENKIRVISNELLELKKAINDSFTDDEEMDKDSMILYLVRKGRLEDELRISKLMYNLDLSKLRYKKGIDVIKILYEKVLGLDHHFSSLRTHSSVQQLSNPNTYSEFKLVKDGLEDRLYKKSSIKIPTVLQSNSYVSAILSLASSLFGDGKTAERQEDLTAVSCILDFTLKMSKDLNLIYFETEYLVSNNNKLVEECLLLFDEYTQVIGYKTPLDRCRNSDDWDQVFISLNLFIEDLKAAAELGDERLLHSVVNKGHINLEFAVDRLVSYIDKYSAFITQGENYYNKFAKIVENYDNEISCSSSLPIQFSMLKEEVKHSTEKFIQAYDIAELRGSKLRDLLYGYN